MISSKLLNKLNQTSIIRVGVHNLTSQFLINLAVGSLELLTKIQTG
jgi:hypothetical protein